MNAPRRRGRNKLRALASLRFVAYAAVLALGLARLIGPPGTSTAEPRRASPPALVERARPGHTRVPLELVGQTAQSRSVRVLVSGRGAEVIALAWLARCPDGEVRGPFDFDGLMVDPVGSRFSGSAVFHDRYADGTRTRVEARVTGRLTHRGRSAAGVVAIADEVRHPGRAAMACGPGRVRWKARSTGP